MTLGGTHASRVLAGGDACCVPTGYAAVDFLNAIRDAKAASR